MSRARRPPRHPPRPEPERRVRERPTAAPTEPDRRESGNWIYGWHAVRAALANHVRRCHRLVATAETASEVQKLLGETQARLLPDFRTETLDRARLEALLSKGAVHQGVALLAEPLPQAFLEDVLSELPPAPSTEPAVVVVLDQVSDPHNVGAILRSAAAFGARAVVLPEHGTPPVSAALAKAASGALEQVPLIRVPNLARTLDRLKEAGFWSVGLDESSEKTLAELDLSGRVALVLGAEGEGLRRLTRERCDFLARLPTSGPIASLNVSNAAAIALYEVARRREKKEERP